MKCQWVKKTLFLIPSMAGVCCFFLFPLLYCILFSFSRTFGRFTYHGLQNYWSLFRSQAFLLAFENTFLLQLIYIICLLVLSVGISYVFEPTKRVLSFLTTASVSMFFPSALIINFMKEFPDLCDIYPRLVFFLIFIWKYIGVNSLILESAFSNMNQVWMEAASLDGANKRQAFIHIELPYILPHLKFLFVFDIICFFKMFRESYLLYGLYPPDKIYMIQNFFFNNFQNLNYQRLSTGTVLTVLMLLILNAVIFRIGEKNEMV